MNKTRITYKLDHQNPRPVERINQDEGRRVIPLYDNEFRVVEDTPLTPEYPNDYGAWNSPFDAETKRIEQLIRASNTPQRKEMNARQSPYISNHVDDDEFNARPEVVLNQAHYIQRNGVPWMKIISTAIGAIITGVLLGFFIISMFSKTQTATSQLPENSAVPSQSQAGADNTADDAGNASTGSIQDNIVAVQIPSRTYTVLQNGSFTKEQSANQEVENIRNKGLAAVAESADKYYVYIGIAADHHGAQTLSQKLSSEKLDIYLKPYTLPALEKVKWTGTSTELPNYTAQADQLIQTLSGIALIHLEESTLTPIAASTIQSIQAAHEAWSASSDKVIGEAPTKEQTLLQKMANAMNTAERSAEEYNKSPSLAMLWQVQTNLIQFIMAEKIFLSDVTVQ